MSKHLTCFRLTLFLNIALFLFFRQNAWGQSNGFDEDWRWVQFTTESGLPSNKVTQVLETPGGTVWAATSEGIAWFDGYKWISVNSRDSGSGLTQPFIVGLYNMDEDGILVSTSKGVYTGTKDGLRFLIKFPVRGPRNIIPLSFDSLLFHFGDSLFLYKHGTMKPFESDQFQLNEKILEIRKTESGTIWMRTIDGLYRWENRTWKKFLNDENLPSNIPNLVENRRGTGIIDGRTVGEGLTEWYNGTSPQQNLREKSDVVQSLDVGPNNEAIIIYQSGDVRFRQNKIWSSFSLKHGEIKDILFVKLRANGDLWVGTEHGLYLYNRSSSRWTNFNHESPDVRNYVNEIIKTRNGSVWLATGNGVEIINQNVGRTLVRPNLTTGRTEVRPTSITTVLGIPLNAVTGLCEDDEGNIWISSGSAFEGALRWDGKSWKHFRICDTCDAIFVHKIRKDLRGRLWFLGLGKTGQSEQPGAFVLENGTFTRWGKEEGLPSGRVYSFAEGMNGEYWFGTAEGLSRWRPSSPHRHPEFISGSNPDGSKQMPKQVRHDHPHQGSWTHWSVAEKIRTHRVFTLAVDHENRLWFGSWDVPDAGLGYIDEHDSIQFLTTNNGLVDNRIIDLRVDSLGELWIATQRGLSSFARGFWTTFNENSGLIYPNLWSVLPLRDKIYVGTHGKGLAILNRIESTSPPPRVFFEKPIVEEQDVTLRWKPLAYWGEVHPHDILTRYSITDSAVSGWSAQHQVSYKNLKPGNYVLHVLAKGLFGNYNPTGESISFTVPPPFYFRPVVYLPAGVLLLGLMALAGTLLNKKRAYDISLRKSEAKFRSVTEMTSSAIFIYNESNIIFANHAATSLTGYSLEELQAMRLYEFIHSEERIEIEEQERKRSGKTTVPHRTEFRIITKSGTERWLDFTTGWINFQGKPAMIGSAFEITERKLAEEQILADQEQLRSLASELSRTEDRERRRLAVQLHDTIGQSLLFSKMKLQLLQRSPEQPDAKKEMGDLRRLIEQSINETRTLMYELSPPILYDLGLKAALEWLIREMKQKHTLAMTFEDDETPKPLTDELRIFFFNAIREALTNIIKHANAQTVKVRLHSVDGNVQAIIIDDGIGFDSATLKQTAGKDGGFGLASVRERAKHLGCTFSIESVIGKGTTVTLSSPLALKK